MPAAFALSFPAPVPPDTPGRRFTLPSPGGEPALRDAAARFAAQRPDEPWIAVDPADGGFHLLVEGDPEDLEATGSGSGPGLVEQVVIQAVGLPWRVAGAVRHPERALGGALAAGERLAGAVTSVLWSRPDTPYDDADVRLDVTWLRVDLDRLAPLIESPGARLDDVLASAVTRALREDLVRLGHDGDAHDADELARAALGEVADPPGDLDFAGRAPSAIRPLPLPAGGAGLALAALRDDDTVTIGIAAPDPDVLAGELDAAIDELLEAVEAPAAPPAAETPPAPVAPIEPVDFDAPPEPLPGEPEPPVETPTELVAEVADAGAQDGAGAQVHVQEPWDGYAALSAHEVVARLGSATPEELAVVAMYERLHGGRTSIVEAAELALSRR
ncbi:MAG TPA: hypothetical protein VNB64_03290 [Solirubrobacteraceae bacterium]|nr:hypothetical protein [Solirubrobacteraceae bacterium]